MHITFSPQWRSDALTVSKQGDILTINDIVYDFSVIPDGATLPADAVDCLFIIGLIERIAGTLHLTMLLPHGSDATPAALFPAPLINPPDGLLELPQ